METFGTVAMEAIYNPPLSLTIIGTVFIGSCTLVAAWIAFDIIVRRGWKTMMAVMIPVYILNALYLAPITLWTYLKYGRPERPVKKSEGPGVSRSTSVERVQKSHDMGNMGENGQTQKVYHGEKKHHMDHEAHDNHQHHMATDHATKSLKDERNAHHDHSHHHNTPLENAGHDMGDHDKPGERGLDQSHDVPSHQHDIVQRNEEKLNHSGMNHSQMDHSHMNHGAMNHGAMHNMHMPSTDQPMFPTVTIAVCHCGAGCLLGDIVGEWLVFGTNATLGGKSIGPEFLIDYGFALLFGIFFQYFSIAPMTGDYGPKTLWRAAKADFMSLTCFEIGLFGWMAIFQFAIFDQKLGMDNVVYWWMMQIGMFFGHWTAFPINWWLITSKVKERVS